MTVTVRDLMGQLGQCDPEAEVWVKETGEDDVFIEADGIGSENLGKGNVVTVEFHYGAKF